MTLFDKPLVLLKQASRSSDCHAQIVDKDNKVLTTKIGGACHGSFISRSRLLETDSGNKLLCLIREKDLVYTVEDLVRWCEYLKLCGMPFYYDGLKETTLGSGYSVDADKFHVVRAETSEYKGAMHLFAAVTLMRQIYYGYRDYFQKVPQAIFDLKKNLKKKLTPIGAACVAYYCVDGSDSEHGFIGHRGIGNYNTKTILRKVGTAESINSLLSSSDKHLPIYYYNKLATMYRGKNFKGIEKMLFPVPIKPKTIKVSRICKKLK